jgi:hypothetical protein
MESLVKDNKRINWKIAMLMCSISYIIVFTFCTAHSIVAIMKMDPPPQTYKPGYFESLPFHPLYTIIIWSLFAYLCYRIANTGKIQWKVALSLGLSWSIFNMFFDLIAWVLIKHPYALTFYEFYVKSQPWITIAYVAIFVSPFIGMFWIKKSKIDCEKAKRHITNG